MAVPPLVNAQPLQGPRIRDAALDFTKGVLVLLMILYHWLNYFVPVDEFVYRYLRFITPSFIFLAGFLIASVYLTKYSSSDLRLPKRLLQRGIKLLLLFTALNCGMFLKSLKDSAEASYTFAEALLSIYVIGDGRLAAFEILAPISYLLLLAVILVLAYRRFEYVFHLACVLSFVGVALLSLSNIKAPNLELIAMGFLGMVVGLLSPSSLRHLAAHLPGILAAYLLYALAVGFWNVIYPLQVAGVCLNLALLYVAGTKVDSIGSFRHLGAWFLLLGKYSLLSYIVQIVVLQLMRLGMRSVDQQLLVLFLSFVGAFGLTVLLVATVQRANTRLPLVERFYRFLFA